MVICLACQWRRCHIFRWWKCIRFLRIYDCNQTMLLLWVTTNFLLATSQENRILWVLLNPHRKTPVRADGKRRRELAFWEASIGICLKRIVDCWKVDDGLSSQAQIKANESEKDRPAKGQSIPSGERTKQNFTLCEPLTPRCQNWRGRWLKNEIKIDDKASYSRLASLVL